MKQRIAVLGTLGEIGLYGKRKLEKALKEHPVDGQITLALYADAESAGQNVLACPQTREAYAFEKTGDGYLLLGYDETGLMYGCQELSERLAAKRPLVAFSDKPYTKTRGLYAFLHNEDLEEELFYNPVYWIDFFDEMAQNRYNSFNLVFSHQTSYLVPMFAYFLDMPEFPDVYPEGVDKRKIHRNHDMLSFIAKQAENRGIDFILGIWQVSPWKGEQVIPVHGLTHENLKPYTYTGMKHIIEEFPAVKGLQIRANWESGIPTEEQTDFFTHTLFQAMAEAPRPFLFDFRCWLAEPETVQNALKMVPGTRLSCKYWAEFLGAPYQPAKISAGYSYSDFLRQPMQTDLIYQVWSLGSPRLLLWGSPEYVRRFVHSLTLGGGTGFEINLPLAQKGYGNEHGYWRILRNGEDEYYTHEYQRYWLMNRLFGRLSYNPDCGEDAWMNEMRERLGASAEKAMRLYNAGSQIITFLIQYTLSDPNMYIWPEIDTNGSLDIYMKTPTSDVCVIDGIESYVERLYSGDVSGKYTPYEAALHFDAMAKDVFDALHEFTQESKEGVSLRKDFMALAFLARYHAAKTRAAVALKKWYETWDIHELRICREEIHRATVCWERLISETEGYYHEQMVTGPNDAGCWKTKRPLVWADELHVEALLREAEETAFMRVGYDFGPARPEGISRSYYKIDFMQSYPQAIGYRSVCAKTAYTAERGYGFVSGEPRDIMMPRVLLSDLQFDPWSRDNWRRYPIERTKNFESALFEDAVCGEGEAVFRCDLPNGEYIAEFYVEDHTESACLRGPMDVTIGGIMHPGLKVYPGEKCSLRERVTVNSGRLEVKLSGHWFVTAIRVYDLSPVLRSAPYVQLNTDDSVLTASAWSPNAIAQVRLECGDGDAIPMIPDGPNTYRAELRQYLAKHPQHIHHFRLCAADEAGHTVNAPITVRYACKASAFDVHHEPVTSCVLGRAIPVSLSVESTYPIRKAVLHYSHVNQFEGMQEIAMECEGGVWRASIPADYPKYEWDLLYYIELVDEIGNGMIYPDFHFQTPYYVISPVR